jgi:hypothetical protein
MATYECKNCRIGRNGENDNLESFFKRLSELVLKRLVLFEMVLALLSCHRIAVHLSSSLKTGSFRHRTISSWRFYDTGWVLS